MIAMIAAVSKNGVIGKDGKIPWHLPADLKYFKEQTEGCPVIMGLPTFLSIGKPLPNRLNIILSRSSGRIEGCEVFRTLTSAIMAGLTNSENNIVFIGGGADVYKQVMSRDFAEMLLITEVDVEVDGDRFFPEIDPKKWREVSRVHRSKDDKNEYDMDFVIYERK